MAKFKRVATGGFGTWHTADGRQFATQSEAERHEQRNGLASNDAPKDDLKIKASRAPHEVRKREGARQAEKEIREAQKGLTSVEREAALRGVGQPKQRPTAVPLAETREQKLQRQAKERKTHEADARALQKLQRAVDDATPEARRAKNLYGATTPLVGDPSITAGEVEKSLRRANT